MNRFIKKDIKKDVFFIYIAIAFTLQNISGVFSIRNYIFVVGVMLSLIPVYVLKNRYLATVCCVAVVSALSFWNSKYIFFSLIAILLICTHKNIVSNISDKAKKKKGDLFTSLLMQACFFLSIGLIIYSFIIFIEREQSLRSFSLGRLNNLLFCFVALMVFAVWCEHKKAIKKSSGELSFFHFICVLGCVGATLYYNIESWPSSIGSFTAFFPWFLLLCSMFYNDDPYIKLLSDKIEDILSKASDKK